MGGERMDVGEMRPKAQNETRHGGLLVVRCGGGLDAETD